MKRTPAPPAVMHWLETDFKRGLEDPEVIELAKAMLKVGFDQGHSVETILQRLIASTVLDIACMSPDGPTGN